MQKIEKTIIKNVDYFDMRGWMYISLRSATYFITHPPSLSLRLLVQVQIFFAGPDPH